MLSERTGQVIAYYASCFGFILIGGLLGWSWTFPVGGGLAILGGLLFVITGRNER